jgi:hypothetical protein
VLRAGFHLHLEKPVGLEALIGAVALLVQHRVGAHALGHATQRAAWEALRKADVTCTADQ